MQMQGRRYSPSSGSGPYRYGFNGKENDNDVKGEGNQQDYGMRIYDPRLGRFLSVDPIRKDYPELTPYQFSSNEPIAGIDIDGLERVMFHIKTGKIMTGPYDRDDPENGWFSDPPAGTAGYWAKKAYEFNHKQAEQIVIEKYIARSPLRTTSQNITRELSENKNQKSSGKKENGFSSTIDKIGVITTSVENGVLQDLSNKQAVLGISKGLEWVRNYYPRPGQTRLFSGNQYTWALKYSNLYKGLKIGNNILTGIGLTGDALDYYNNNIGEGKFLWQSTKFGVGLRYPWVGVAISIGELDESSALNELNQFFDDMDKENMKKEKQKELQKQRENQPKFERGKDY